MTVSYLQSATLSLTFVIIGGGVAGLSCAIALRRVGHRVIVLERNESADRVSSGCRLTPNLTKILYHWGLEEKLRKMTVKSDAISLSLFESGELLGTHVWDQEMLREVRGEFLATHHSDLRRLLYDTAISYGAEIRLGKQVVDVDPYSRAVTLGSGEVVHGDVIVGADGKHGLTRRMLLDEPEDHTPGDTNLYSTTIPKERIIQHPDLCDLIYGQKQTRMMSWFGDQRYIQGWPIGGKQEGFNIIVYAPRDGNEGTWEDRAPITGMQAALASAHPQLQKLGEIANQPICVPLKDYPELEDWVHESGRMVVIGEAAHPLPPGSIQESAMIVEDGAVLAKLFSHLRSEDQIASFLWAFEDLRKPRCDMVHKKELGDIYFMTMGPGEVQEYRDSSMRAKRDAGLSPLSASDELEETPEWSQMKEVFGYDAEDEADNWWIQWGLLRERAKGTDLECGFMEIITANHP
ncbi:hypothetical protein BD779DRAFT_331964 [Infundibulicybe gibba]|nr:hypothetical protein BD779DRAFT_331964 [Infundibulicybe gibba]